MNTQFIQSHPQITMGKPVIVGTRITVESTLERLGAGETPEQIVAAHPLRAMCPRRRTVSRRLPCRDFNRWANTNRTTGY
jgi:hypothetical protein